MANKMLIDAAHPEETRVVVVRGNRVEEFDFEAANRKQLRGNIYLAKITRVEPSLQAAFVEYGGNRHGFLAFSEIHPDYYQIPVADRQALLDQEEEDALQEARSEADEHADEADDSAEEADYDADFDVDDEESGDDEGSREEDTGDEDSDEEDPDSEDLGNRDSDEDGDGRPVEIAEAAGAGGATIESEPVTGAGGEENDASAGGGRRRRRRRPTRSRKSDSNGDDNDGDDDDVELVGAEDALEEVPVRRRQPRKQYKIQEVIKRRQVVLVQVVKEERGNKGAALTTYLSLAGRYSVLMPNTPRGGGISRKITNPSDRKRLKQIASELEVTEGMGVILRTAGASRTKAEVKRDFEYLLRLWETVRDLTLGSIAPTLVYEEGSLIKRSIRDLYNRDIDQVQVAGEDGYREAKDFMRMLMPSHAKNVQPYRDSTPIFTRFGVESQLDAMFSPQVTLKSGGYVVINPTEALVSIDVNSGKATKEHSIEDTALQTNLEAAEEVARQLRLRDLAGLIVIDFIDMEEKRNNRAVERRLKECLKSDRARIQVGRISHFGLLEMSRQRIRTGVLEGSTSICPHCQGSGIVRSTESVALHVLRALEDHLLKSRKHNLSVNVRAEVALYILNQKRAHLTELENRFGLNISVTADETVNGQHYTIERGELASESGRQPVLTAVQPDAILFDDDDAEFEAEVEADAEIEAEAETETEEQSDGAGGRKRRRRRRRRRGGGDDTSYAPDSEDEYGEAAESPESGVEAREAGDDGDEDDESGEPRRRRRRGRRGGRRSRRSREAGSETDGDESEEADVNAAVPEGAEQGGDVEQGEAPSPGDDGAGEDESAGVEALGTETPAEEASGEEAGEQSETIADDIPIVIDGLATASAEPDEIQSGDETEEPAPTTLAMADLGEAEATEARNGADEAVAEEDAAEERAAEPEDDTAEEGHPDEDEDDPDRPKRSGWWQRRSFF